jgi:hypothetical protein
MSWADWFEEVIAHAGLVELIVSIPIPPQPAGFVGNTLCGFVSVMSEKVVETVADGTDCCESDEIVDTAVDDNEESEDVKLEAAVVILGDLSMVKMFL